MRVKNSLVVCLVFAFFSVLLPASATVINTYSSESLWATETVAGFTTISFSVPFYGSSISDDGATFTTDSMSNLEVFNTTQSYWDYAPYALIPVAPATDPPTIFVSLPSNVTSIGFNLTTDSPYNDPLTVTINGVSYSVPSTPPSGGFAFFGATFTTPITSFEIQSTAGDYLLTNNFSFGTEDDTSGSGGPGNPSPTPEAASLLMIGAGLIGMRLASKRMHLFGA